MTKLTIEMPAEAARRLQLMLSENPEKVKAEFKKKGLDIVNIFVVLPEKKSGS